MIELGEKKVIEELEEWYKAEQPMYESLANKIGNLIEDILEEQGIDYHSVTTRAKEVSSVVEKSKLKKYKDPKKEIQDFAGIRVITFVRSDVVKTCELIKPEFIIDEDNSMDKGKELGEDRVGYRSVHYVAQLSEDRINLPEYKKFAGMNFEIQIRTILEHAWADISHDRTYKFNNSLTDQNDIRRRFALAAASLEMVDREFDRLANEIEQFSTQVAEGDLSYIIDDISLTAYMKSIFSDSITYNDDLEDLIEELNIMEVYTLLDLDKIISELVGKNYKKLMCDPEPTIYGVTRDILIIKFWEDYFERAWRNNWGTFTNIEIAFFRKFGLDYIEIIEKYALKPMNNAE